MIKLLIVDDEVQMRELLTIYLRQYDFIIDEAEDGYKAYEKIKKEDYDLIILDVMMPIMDGREALIKIREISNVPVIMLTAKGETEDKVAGLSGGADDYLVKPFEEEELVARIQALLRRAKTPQLNNDVLKYKGLTVYLSAREVFYNRKDLKLTQTEFDLMQTFIEHKGSALSREQLVELVWGIEFMGDDRTIDSHIKNLREKLKKSGMKDNIIQTVWGIGYKLV